MPEPFVFDQAMTAGGVGGGLVSALVNQAQGVTRWRKAADALAGMILATGCGPAAADAVGLAQENMRVGLSVGIGLVGAVAAKLVMDWANGSGLRDWINRLIGTAPGAPKV